MGQAMRYCVASTPARPLTDTPSLAPPARVPAAVRACGIWTALALAATALILLSACGGGGGGAATVTAAVADTPQAQTLSLSITSRRTGTTYPLSVRVPAAGAVRLQDMAVLYALDGETWFTTLAGAAAVAPAPVIVVAIHTAGLRNRDYVPPNTCTSGGGGQAAYLDFLREELVPFIEAGVGGHPARRLLWGHSHGGSLVLDALFAQPAASHSFAAYLSAEASIPCLPATAAQWEQDYAAANADLPVRLHLASATAGNGPSNVAFGDVLARRGYAGLRLRNASYTGSHQSIVPQAVSDGLAFALSSLP